MFCYRNSPDRLKNFVLILLKITDEKFSQEDIPWMSDASVKIHFRLIAIYKLMNWNMVPGRMSDHDQIAWTLFLFIVEK